MTSLASYPPLDIKPVIALAPVSRTAGGASTSAAIDLLGFDGFVVLPAMGVGDTALATTITECDTSGGTFVAVNDEESTPAAVSIAHLATDDGTFGAGPGYFRTDRRQRYIKIVVTGTGGTASLVAALVLLVSPRDSAKQNVAYSYAL